MRCWSLSLACLVIASAASAECPTSDDMNAGVTLSREEPLFSSTFTRRADGIIEERRFNLKDGGTRIRTTLYHGGLIPFELKDRGGATLRSEFAQGVTLPSLPVSPGEYEIDQVTYADGKPFAEASSKITVGRSYDSISIEDCYYETRKIRIASKGKIFVDSTREMSHYFEHDYSTELGIIIRTIEYRDQTFQDPIAIVEYDTITAEGL